MKRYLSILTVLLLLLSLLTGCGAASYDKMESAADAPAAEAPMEMLTEGSFAENATADSATGSAADPVATDIPAEQKLIRRVYMDAQTLSMDEMMSWLESRVSELGGYFEQKSIRRSGSRDDGSYYRSADMTIRVPAKNLDGFVEQVGENANVISSTEEADDVTLTYVATQSRVQALETEQTRLLELLEGAENMEDLLAIEARLTEVRSELQTYASQLRVLENQVSYSTIYLSVWEVDKPTVVAERTVWQKIGDGFTENAGDVWDGLVNAFIWILTAIPYLVPLALIAGVVLLVLKLTVFRKKKVQQAPKDPEEK